MHHPQGRRSRRPAVLALLGVLALVLGLAAVGVALTRQVQVPPSPSVSVTGEEETAAEGEPGGVPGPAVTEQQGPEQDVAQESAGEVPSTSGSTSPEVAADPLVDPLPRSEPVAVSIPAIGVSSPLHPLGLAPDGTLQVPSGERYDEAAWYDGSPTPGEVGPSVIEGHVTGAGGRPSVFFELGALTPGDMVEVDREDGTTARFEVYRVQSHPKDAFPTVAVYGPTAEPELRVITCGGEFDDGAGRHLDNTVVWARLVPGHEDG